MTTKDKIYHWLVFLAFMVCAYTALMNTTFYSKEAIMETFNFSFSNLGIYDIGKADQLFIARIERRVGWVFHFYAGMTLFAIMLLSLISRFKKLTKMYLTKYLILSTITISGIPLYIRAFIDIPMNYQNFSREIHFYTAWIVVAFVIAHVIIIIYKENTDNNNLLSNMFKFKLLFIALLISLPLKNLHAQEKATHLEIAMAYYKGEMGGTTISLIMPNCPYDNCKKAEMMKRKMKVQNVDGQDVVYIKQKDVKRALFFFEKSSIEDKNPEGSKYMIKMLLGALNYKDNYIEPLLLKSLKKDFDFDLEQYDDKLKNALINGTTQNDCFSTFKHAQFVEFGYRNLFEKDKSHAKKLYGKAYKICSDGQMEKILASSKM